MNKPKGPNPKGRSGKTKAEASRVSIGISLPVFSFFCDHPWVEERIERADGIAPLPIVQKYAVLAYLSFTCISGQQFTDKTGLLIAWAKFLRDQLFEDHSDSDITKSIKRGRQIAQQALEISKALVPKLKKLEELLSDENLPAHLQQFGTADLQRLRRQLEAQITPQEGEAPNLRQWAQSHNKDRGRLLSVRDLTLALWSLNLGPNTEVQRQILLRLARVWKISQAKNYSSLEGQMRRARAKADRNSRTTELLWKLFRHFEVPHPPGGVGDPVN